LAGKSDSQLFQNKYDRERKKIDEKLSRLLKNHKPKSLYEPCEYIISNGGKRLRPLLVLFSAEAVGGKFSQAYNAAVGVELLHNFTLVHDDIMDNSDLRRGRITLHKKYNVNTAILAGDNLIGIAYNSLLKDSKTNCVQIVSSFTNAIIEVCEGQSYDTDFELKKSVTVEDYLLMINKKTAVLLERCCEIGGLIGGGSKNDVIALKKYGHNIGMAFQFQDDLLDIMGNQEKFGKPIGADLVEGKKTFLFLRALEKAKGKDKSNLTAVIKNKGVEKDQIDYFRKMYIKLGVLEEAKDEIDRYTKLALKSISSLENKSSVKLFEWLANYLIKRSY